MTKVLQVKLTLPLRAKRRDRPKRGQMRGTEAGLVAGVPLGRRTPQSLPSKMGKTQRKIRASHNPVAGLHHVAPNQAGPQVLGGVDLEVVPNGIRHPQGKALHQIMQCTLAVLHLPNRRMMWTTEYTVLWTWAGGSLNFCY